MTWNQRHLDKKRVKHKTERNGRLALFRSKRYDIDVIRQIDIMFMILIYLGSAFVQKYTKLRFLDIL